MLIAICDDMPELCMILKDTLLSGNYLHKEDEILEFHSATELLKQAPLQMLDLLFLDIEMPEMSGLDFMRQYRHLLTRAKIVFLTSYSDYAAQGYELDIFRYLEKPVQPEKLTELFQSLEREEVLNRIISVHVQGTDYPIRLGNILYVEVYNNCSFIVTMRESLKCHIRLKEFKQLLPSEFFYQSNKSYILNLRHIQLFDRKTGMATMSNGARLDVAYRNRRAFKKMLTSFTLCE